MPSKQQLRACDVQTSDQFLAFVIHHLSLLWRAQKHSGNPALRAILMVAERLHRKQMVEKGRNA